MNRERQFLQDKDVAARFGVHRTAVWRWVKSEPSFPRPVLLSAGTTRWRLADIEAWENSRPCAA